MSRPTLRSLSPLLLFGFPAWALTYLGARALLDSPGAAALGGMRWLVALVPLPFFVAWLLGVMGEFRRMDELGRRIQLEALAIAFSLTLVLLMTLGLLEVAAPLDPANWSYRNVWPLVMLCYITGLLIARRRYRWEP